MKKLYFGTAYYYEYLPYDRLEKDVRMLQQAGINVVRIAESTWSTLEPQNGLFDFTSIDKVLDAMYSGGIDVIIGTPTYAVPTWMVKEHPSILAVTKEGPNKYGPRQNMDITNPSYLFYCERVIRNLMNHVKNHPVVIGYQVDNETKHYGTSGDNVQTRFIKYCREKFHTTDELNTAFGLDYWSNRINSWEDFPSVDGSINASLSCEFSRFQRKLVTDFLAWQVSLVNEYKLNHQFVTHNFDFEWRGYSFGVQSDVNQFEASRPMDIVGIDVYHPTQDNLTGCEISFCGDLARSLKQQNYFVIETEAQGHADWLPYPGQLRLQAFSHLASGANMVTYWHYHSIHNSLETYWKGLLSHDFESNPTYEEAITIGSDFERLGKKLVNLRKNNKIALLISNISLSAFNWFKYFMKMDYNDYVRRMYDSLYKMNAECDIIDPSCSKLNEYKMIVVAPLYAAEDDLLYRLNEFVKKGGHAVYGIRSGFCNEHVQVRHSRQPGIIEKACGIHYNQFTEAGDTRLQDGGSLSGWIELITSDSAEILYRYDHPYWGKYAAVTENRYGKGCATYIGCFPDRATMKRILERTLKNAGLWDTDQELFFPLITRWGTNDEGQTIRYYLNYSQEPHEFTYSHKRGMELIKKTPVNNGDKLKLPSWGVLIIEEE